MDDLTVANMRSRVDRCRWLAMHTTDAATAAELRKMADDGEADIERVLRERGEQPQLKIEISPRTVK